MWVIVPLILILLLIRITLQIDLCRDRETYFRISAQAAGFHKVWNHIEPGQFSHNQPSWGRKLLSALPRSQRARRFLLRHSEFRQLDGLLLLHTEDAAQAALLSAALQSAISSLPVLRQQHARIRILPEFFRSHSSLRLRCIVCCRLGTIVLTTLLLLNSFVGQLMKESEAL